MSNVIVRLARHPPRQQAVQTVVGEPVYSGAVRRSQVRVAAVAGGIEGLVDAADGIKGRPLVERPAVDAGDDPVSATQRVVEQHALVAGYAEHPAAGAGASASSPSSHSVASIEGRWCGEHHVVVGIMQPQICSDLRGRQ